MKGTGLLPFILDKGIQHFNLVSAGVWERILIYYSGVLCIIFLNMNLFSVSWKILKKIPEIQFLCFYNFFSVCLD